MITLNAGQEKAVELFQEFLLNPTQKEIVIGGSAGTGKTFLMKYLLKIVRSQKELYKLLLDSTDDLQVYLTSTTHKAAKVLRDITGEEVRTIHSLLGIKPYRDYKTGKEVYRRSEDSDVIYNHLVIIDEASMINPDLLDIIRKSTFECKVLYIGDPYQLAPMGMNDCPVFSTIKNQVILTEIQRQAENSPIITLFNKFKDAVSTDVFPQIESSACGSVLHVDGSTMRDMVEQDYSLKHDHDDLRVVAWTNKTCIAYNKHIRKFLGNTEETYQIGELLVANEPIMDPKQNNKVLFKNDTRLEVTESGEMQEMHGLRGHFISLDCSTPLFVPADYNAYTTILKHYAKHQDWKTYYALKDYCIDVRPLHANSVHKSQGSTYQTIYIDVDDIGRNTKKYEIARLMYVAISRAQQRVVLKGTLPDRVYR